MYVFQYVSINILIYTHTYTHSHAYILTIYNEQSTTPNINATLVYTNAGFQFIQVFSMVILTCFVTVEKP